MHTAFKRFRSLSFFSLLGGVALTALLAAHFTPPALAANPAPISGWAWSDTIGWISMSGSGYGLTMAGNGDVSGYAWSDNIGWVSANGADIAACQGGSQTLSHVLNGTWSGWLRALAGGSAQSGGWDGCISMSGSGYGVSFDPSTGKFGQTSKFAWGSDVVGWIDFSLSSTAPQSCTASCSCAGNTLNCTLADCTTTSQLCSYQCSPSQNACIPPPTPTGHIHAVPSVIATGGQVTISWDAQNVNNCKVSGSNGDSGGQWNTPAGGDKTLSSSHLSSPISTQTIYTFSCNGVGNIDPNGFTPMGTVTVNIIPVFREI